MISTRILKPAAPSDGAEQLRGHDQTVGERLERDRAVLQRLPAIAYDACDKRPGRVSSLSLVRYRPDYSVPTRFGPRCWSAYSRWSSSAGFIRARGLRLRSGTICPCRQRAGSGGSLGRLAVAAGADLRRLLEARMGNTRCCGSSRASPSTMFAAISELERGVIGFDAVKHRCRIEKRPPRLNLLAHPYLPRAEVATTSPGTWGS